MPVMSITSLCPWENHLTLFPEGSLCGVERQHRGLFRNGKYAGENIKITSGHGIAGISESRSG